MRLQRFATAPCTSSRRRSRLRSRSSRCFQSAMRASRTAHPSVPPSSRASGLSAVATASVYGTTRATLPRVSVHLERGAHNASSRSVLLSATPMRFATLETDNASAPRSGPLRRGAGPATGRVSAQSVCADKERRQQMGQRVCARQGGKRP